MAPNSLSPASVVIDYSSLFAPHKMTIPTREWFPVNITGLLGSFSNWSSISVDGQDMVEALINKLKPFVPPTTTFTGATVYTMATAGAPNIPRATVALAVVGTYAGSTPFKARSATFMGKTTANGDAKLVLLDAPTSPTFDPSLPIDFSADALALFVEWADPANAWSGRDDAKVNTGRKVTYDLNDKLQKQYKMS